MNYLFKAQLLLNFYLFKAQLHMRVIDPHVAVQVEVQTHSGEDQSPGEK